MSIQIPECGYGSDEMEADPEEELEKLESEVKQMAEKILHYRQTLPDQLKEAFALLVSDQRRDSTGNEPGSQPGTSGDASRGLGSGNSQLLEGTALSEVDKQMAEKIQLLKEKTMKNVADVPILLKRMKECISKIDNLDPNHRTIHPAFTKDRASRSTCYKLEF